VTKYEELKKRLNACVNSTLKQESMCDANNILVDISQCNELSINQLKELMELYYKVKANSLVDKIVKS
jgi:hypothetical protein